MSFAHGMLAVDARGERLWYPQIFEWFFQILKRCFYKRMCYLTFWPFRKEIRCTQPTPGSNGPIYFH